MGSIALFQNRTTNGAGTAFECIEDTSSPLIHGTIHVSSGSIFGGNCSCVLQASIDGSDWIDVPGTGFGYPTMIRMGFEANFIRLFLRNASGGTNVSAKFASPAHFRPVP